MKTDCAYEGAITAIKAALAQPAQDYAAKNPLGGPAKIFDAMAACIRAGDSFDAVLRQYGFAEAQPVQEPVAWQWLGSAQFRKKIPKGADKTAWSPLYTTPPQRPWVGLTDEEINKWTPEIHGVIQAIEAKLKEKNS